MATRRFCDLCGKPAVEQRTFEILQTFGPEREDEEHNKYRAHIRVVLNFDFRNIPGGYHQPPDLCGVCVLNLLDKLKEHVERNAKP